MNDVIQGLIDTAHWYAMDPIARAIEPFGFPLV